MVVVPVFLASLVAVAYASPSGRSPMIVHESRTSAPAGFANSGAASPDITLNLRLALVQGNMAGLEKALMDVSTPSSANYGKHLSKEEVEALVKPSQASVDAVNQFLSSNGINATTLSPAGDWLGFSLPVSKANSLFDAEFSTFTHIASGKQSIRTLSYSIPASLKGHLDLVHPTVTFEGPSLGLPVVSSPIKASNIALDGCGSTVNPSCLQSLYNIPTTKASQSSNTIGVAGFIGQYANQADLTTFLGDFRQDLDSSTTFTLDTIDGGQNPQDPSQAGTEANLDIQYTVGVASGVPVTFISVGDQNQDGDLAGFLDIINHLLGESNPPQVLTTSYGQNENTISQSLAVNLCNAYAQLGARGVSILFASGDGGVSGSQSADCSTFVPTFPSGCPYMTSVGATTGSGPETAAQFSAGGFSNYFGIPSYQSSAVSSYIQSIGNTNSGLYNTSGRGYPDVSAQGQQVEIVVGGQTGAVNGTSCSSPIFASVVSLLNDQLIAAGKKPLGFLNPFLYSNGASALNDITSGSNPGCNTDGFDAATGWDPVTGLGTPDFNKLKSAVGL